MDRIKESLKNRRFVFWEEIARDGAQAKTILSGKQRAEIANLHSQIFNQNGSDHLVFAAGFVSIAPQEVDVIKEMADGVENCYLAVNCRSVKDEIKASFEAIKKAKYPRVAFVLPASERLSEVMLHKSVEEVFEYGLDIGKYALDNSNGIPVDLQLAAAYDGNPAQIAEFGEKMTELGIATIGLGDTRGRIYPYEIKNFYETLLNNCSKDVLIAPHLHNDLGFALENTLVGLRQGITFACSSWLGLAERNGLVPTELLTFLLSYQNGNTIERLGFDGSSLFLTEPNLKLLRPIAKKISEFTGRPLLVTDPIVGTGVNTISTGTPFVDTHSFQPFDPKEILGVEKEVFVTQLANRRVIIECGNKLGFSFEEENIKQILKIIKEIAYKTNRSIVPENELIELFEKFGQKHNK
ncbi:MAG: hypothetical protein JXL97_13770 [Bacteroidales bacterium]|nr:hypothetical protein [Bacteroidales bacterium]